MPVYQAGLHKPSLPERTDRLYSQEQARGKSQPGIGAADCQLSYFNKLNRGHGLAEFIDAVLMAKAYQIETGVHLILNLPGDDLLDVIENARILSVLGIDNVKLHALYIREDTELGRLYQQGVVELISLDEYIERVITFLEYLSPDIAVQRLIGRAPEEKTLFANWDHSWWKIQEMILTEMERRGTYQGRKYDYPDGKALKRFLK